MTVAVPQGRALELWPTTRYVPFPKVGPGVEGPQGSRRVEACVQQPGLPSPRGPVSHAVIKALAGTPEPVRFPAVQTDNALTDEDLQLALYCCYELHYQGFAAVSDAWEWDVGLLALRVALEAAFEEGLRAAVAAARVLTAEDVPMTLWSLTRDNGFSLSEWLLAHGTRFHAREIAIHRSGYQLKEADPHTWGIPRLTGRAKAAMVTIQADEYGNGVTASMHSSLFADAMTALGLDPTYGVYLDYLPAVTLATTNLISLFGLHRRFRGALVGHLASFEMNSVGPMSRYSAWLQSLGVPQHGRRFYDVHVEADEGHQYVAVDDLVGGLLEREPGQAGELLFGAQALGVIERNFAEHAVSAWLSDRSSLWTP